MKTRFISAAKDLQTLETLLADIISTSSEDHVSAKLRQAQDLVCKIRGRQTLLDNGILSQFRLDGQVALVTGAGQGIGEALGVKSFQFFRSFW